MTTKYLIDHIPKNTPNNRRPAFKLDATTITIHNTGNPSSTAKNERAWLTNLTNTRTASYHLVVDDDEVIECIPLNESTWHSGDGSGLKSGNRTSISIEICESGDYDKTLDNAVELVATMLIDRGWGIDRLRRHWDWSGKVCPRLMYDGGTWATWDKFKQGIQQRIDEKMAKFKDTKGHWAEDTIDEMADKGILNGYPDGTFRPNENMTRAQVAVVAKMIMDKLAK